MGVHIVCDNITALCKIAAISPSPQEPSVANNYQRPSQNLCGTISASSRPRTASSLSGSQIGSRTAAERKPLTNPLTACCCRSAAGLRALHLSCGPWRPLALMVPCVAFVCAAAVSMIVPIMSAAHTQCGNTYKKRLSLFRFKEIRFSWGQK